VIASTNEDRPVPFGLPGEIFAACCPICPAFTVLPPNVEYLQANNAAPIQAYSVKTWKITKRWTHDVVIQVQF
jgi:hypothetical protein